MLKIKVIRYSTNPISHGSFIYWKVFVMQSIHRCHDVKFFGQTDGRMSIGEWMQCCHSSLFKLVDQNCLSRAGNVLTMKTTSGSNFGCGKGQASWIEPSGCSFGLWIGMNVVIRDIVTFVLQIKLYLCLYNYPKFGTWVQE